MALAIREIKQPDGICDIQSIVYHGAQCFAASFGRTIRIYNGRNVVGTHTLPSFIECIMPYQHSYFLFAADRYFLCKDGALLLSEPFERRFSGLRRALALKEHIVLLHGQGYTLCTVSKNGKVAVSKALTDAAFYRICDAAVLGECICILAKTLVHRYIIAYTPAGNALRCARRESPCGDCIFAFRNRLLMIDSDGLWADTALVAEFGNNRVGTVYSDEEHALVFCKNGEVIEITESGGRYTCRTVTRLDGGVCCVQRIGGVYMCGSGGFSCFMNAQYEALGTVRCLGNVRNLSRVPGGCGDAAEEKSRCFEYFSDNEHVRLESLVKTEALEQRRAEQGALVSLYKTRDAEALNYSAFSMLNGQAFVRITSCHCCDAGTLLGTDDFLLLLGDALALVPLGSSVVRCFEGVAYFLAKSKIYALNTETLRLASLETGGSQVHDFVAGPGGVYAVTYEEEALPVNTEKMKSADVHIKKYTSLSQLIADTNILKNFSINDIKGKYDKHKRDRNSYIQCDSGKVFSDIEDGNVSALSSRSKGGEGAERGIATGDRSDVASGCSTVLKDEHAPNGIDRLKDHCDGPEGAAGKGNVSGFMGSDCIVADKESRFVGVNGRIFWMAEDGLRLIYDTKSYIFCITEHSNGLVISCTTGTLFYGLSDGSVSCFDAASTFSFAVGDGLFLVAGDGVRRVPLLKPAFVCQAAHVAVPFGGTAIYRDDRHAVGLYMPVAQDGVCVQLDGASPLRFSDRFATAHATVREGLIALSLISLSTKKATLLLLAISGRSLRVRAEIPLPGPALALCASRGRLAVVLPDGVQVLGFRNGRTRAISTIACSNAYCSGAYFLGREHVAVLYEGGVHRVVSIRRGTSRLHEEAALPFAFCGGVGHAGRDEVRCAGRAVAHAEPIAGAYGTQQGVFIFGRSGAISLVEDAKRRKDGQGG